VGWQVQEEADARVKHESILRKELSDKFSGSLEVHSGVYTGELFERDSLKLFFLRSFARTLVPSSHPSPHPEAIRLHTRGPQDLSAKMEEQNAARRTSLEENESLRTRLLDLLGKFEEQQK
jgi:hypothetical protein